MKTILRVTFDYTGLNEFSIENPEHIPSHGEIFNCKWEEFIMDKDQVSLLEEIEEEDCFMVERFSSAYGKKENVCHIILHTSHVFSKNSSLSKVR